MKKTTPHSHTKQAVHARCFVITVSDTRTPKTDESGNTIVTLLKEAGHEPTEPKIVKDSSADIYEAVRGALSQGGLDAIILNGGTGISKRDVTFETVEKILERKLPGFGELFRALSFQEIGSAAILSRATAGIALNKVIFVLPGSTKAVKLALEKIILPELPHILNELAK